MGMLTNARAANRTRITYRALGSIGSVHQPRCVTLTHCDAKEAMFGQRLTMLYRTRLNMFYRTFLHRLSITHIGNHRSERLQSPTQNVISVGTIKSQGMFG